MVLTRVHLESIPPAMGSRRRRCHRRGMTNTTLLASVRPVLRGAAGSSVPDLTALLAAYAHDELEARATGMWL